MLSELPAWTASTPTYSVLAIKYGSVEVTKDRQFLNFHLYGAPDSPITLDYYFWIVRNDNSTILVDTGFDARAAQRRGREVFIDPIAAFGRVGIQPSSAPPVIATHAHWDHIGNVSHFPHSEVIVGSREVEFLRGPYWKRIQYREHLEGSEVSHLLGVVDSGRATLVEASYSPAQGVEVIQVGGHTPGELVVLVNGESGPLLLASDAVHFYEEYEADRVYAVLSDLQGMYQTYDLLRWIATETGALVIPGHDRDVSGRFPAAGGELGDIATVLSLPTVDR